MDTDDYVINAYLFPIFYFLNKENRQCTINYEGKVIFEFLVENRGINILYALLK